MSKAGGSTKAASVALPAAEDLTPFAHGAAGHEGISSDASGAMIIKPCTEAEIKFYESAKDHPEFQAHMPTFMGSLILSKDPKIQNLAQDLEQNGAATVPPGLAEHKSTAADKEAGEAGKEWVPSGGKKLTTGLAIVLENAAAGFTHPNVLDLKLGARLWDDAAPEAKRQKLDQVAAETTSGTLGFRVAGMKTWLEGSSDNGALEVNTDVKNGYKSFNKVYGRHLQDENVSDAFVRFVGGKIRGEYKRKRAAYLLQRFLREVESIAYVLENEESRMYSASILAVTEGDNAALEQAIKLEEQEAQRGKSGDDAEEDAENEDIGPKVLEVRLIDFAHASWTPGEGKDENALRGVRNIERILKALTAGVSTT